MRVRFRFVNGLRIRQNESLHVVIGASCEYRMNPEFDIMDWPKMGVSKESTSVYCTHREYLYHMPGLYHMCTQNNAEKSRFRRQLRTIY